VASRRHARELDVAEGPSPAWVGYMIMAGVLQRANARRQ
jgi:hypothetical protein